MPVQPDCPRTESWQGLLDATLPPEERERYERHLESCPACQERLDQAEAWGDALRDLGRQLGDPTAHPADPTLVQVLERLHEGTSAPGAASGEPADLYFLRPSDRPGVLGLLGGYEVREVLGQGGMGVVLKAYDPALHRLVAVKVLAAALAGSATARRRFTREAQAAAAVCHDHVVAVHGVDEADGLPYFVMQYVAGESLQDRLDRTGPLELTEVVRIGLQTAAGLAAAHAQGLIHRDIKPANLLLENGLARVKITDFGLARMADDVALTQAGVVAGTPEYMAPEQARGEAVDHRADLFSLGSVLYAMATGRPPFRGSTALAVLRRVSDEAPAPVRALNAEVPAWLEQLIARLLAKDPADRFQSAAEVATLLEGYLAHLRQPATVAAPDLPRAPADGRAGAPAPVGRPGPVRRSRRPWLPAAVVLLTALALPGFLLLLDALHPGQPRPALHQDFRGGRHPLEPLDLCGPDAGLLTKPEDGGFRVTLPADRPRIDAVGLVLTKHLRGDFEITAGYELLHVDPPKTGSGVGLELYVMTDTPTQEAIALARVVRPDGSNVYQCSRMTTTPEDSKRHYDTHLVPASGTSGQVRLTRTGTEVTLWAAEGGAGTFRELCRFKLGAEDLKITRLAANSWRAHEPVDLRITDLTVRNDGLAGEQAADGPLPAAGGQQTGRKGWLAAAGIIGVGITGTALAAVWLSVRRRRTPNGPGRDPGPDRQPEPETAPAMASFSCPGCGKKLKARADLAGKKVKCPQCGGAVPVPGARDGEPGGTPS